MGCVTSTAHSNPSTSICDLYFSKGRADLTIKGQARIWVMEFKVVGVDQSGDTRPLEQIRARDYAAKYRADGRPIIEVGIVFDPAQRQIVSFEAG